MNVRESGNLDRGASVGLLPGFPKWIHAFAWGGVLVLVMFLVGLSRHYHGGGVWSDWTESRELRRPAYAERIYPEDLFRTQANTWSNLAYVLVGFYAIGLGCRDLRQKPPVEGGYLVNTPAMSILFGAACCYLGFGSGLFHASLTRLGQQLDVAAMYAPLVVFIAINLGRWISGVEKSKRLEVIPVWAILVGLVLLASFLLYRYKWSMSSSRVLPTLILIVAAFALLDRFRPRCKMAARWLVLSTVALVIARICWQMDVAGKFSGPDARLQGHAIWHLLTALSLGCMYIYFRSEMILNGRISSPE